MGGAQVRGARSRGRSHTRALTRLLEQVPVSGPPASPNANILGEVPVRQGSRFGGLRSLPRPPAIPACAGNPPAVASSGTSCGAAPGEIVERQDVPETWTVFRRPGCRDRGALPCRLQLGGAPPEPKPRAVEPDAVRLRPPARRNETQCNKDAEAFGRVMRAGRTCRICCQSKSGL